MPVTKVGGRSVIEAGSAVLQPGDESLTLEVGGLFVTLQFEETPDGAPAIRADATGPVTATVRLVNYSNQLGVAGEVTIGVINAKPVMLALTVRTIGNKPQVIRNISYTVSHGGGA
jgi:hypothetical protein